MKRMAARLRAAGVAVSALVLMSLPALAQQGPGPAAPGSGPTGHGPGPGVWHHPFMHHMMMAHHHMQHHHHPGMFLLGGLVVVFALIGLIAVIVLTGRLIRYGGCHGRHTWASLEILEGRYARSEISHDEFTEKKRDLLSRR